MNFKRNIWTIIKAVLQLLLKMVAICFYLVSSLVEVTLKNINQYIKRKI